MNLKHILTTTIVCLAMDIQKQIKELELKFNIDRADCFMPPKAKKKYERLIMEFDVLKVRLKSIQNGN